MSREVRHYWAIRSAVVGGFVVCLTFLWFIAGRQYQTLFGQTSDCGCAIAPLKWPMDVAVGSALLGLATAYLTIRLLLAITVRIRRHVRLTASLRSRGRFVWHHDVKTTILVVPDQEAQAMTVGLWRPRIVITAGLIKRLSGSEIASVLRHEQAHARAHDPLWSLLLESIGATLSWVGGLRHLVNTAFSLRELIADAVATKNYTQASGLSGAMYKLATTARPEAIPAFSPNADRVTKLLNSTWQLPIRWWTWRTIAAGLIVIVGLLFASALPKATVAAQPTLPPEACWLRQVMCARPLELRAERPDEKILLMTPDVSMSHYGR